MEKLNCFLFEWDGISSIYLYSRTTSPTMSFSDKQLTLPKLPLSLDCVIEGYASMVPSQIEIDAKNQKDVLLRFIVNDCWTPTSIEEWRLQPWPYYDESEDMFEYNAFIFHVPLDNGRKHKFFSRFCGNCGDFINYRPVLCQCASLSSCR